MRGGGGGGQLHGREVVKPMPSGSGKEVGILRNSEVQPGRLITRKGCLLNNVAIPHTVDKGNALSARGEGAKCANHMYGIKGGYTRTVNQSSSTSPPLSLTGQMRHRQGGGVNDKPWFLMQNVST